MSKKSTQARRVRVKRFSDFLTSSFLIIILLFFVLLAVHYGSIYARTNSNELYEYSGHFELEEIHKLRNTTYQFKLDNGDTIAANPDIMQYNQRIDEFCELHFLYTANTAVEITTLDGTTIFLSKDNSVTEALGFIYLGSFFALLILVLNIIYLLCFVRAKPHKKKK